MEVVHVRRKDMKEYQRAGLHHAEFFRDQGAVEWGVYKWMMRRARGHGARGTWERQTRRMWKELAARWGVTKTERRRRGEDKERQREALSSGARQKARLGILVCAPLGLKGPRGRVQSERGQWYEVQADMARQHPRRAGTEGPCWSCTKEAGQVPWPVLRLTAWAFPMATMRTTEARGQWWGPVLRLPREVHAEEV